MGLSDEEISELRYQASQVFTPSTAVDERELFGGRIPQIQQVVTVLGQRGQHAIVFGEHGVGKTSFGNVITGFLATTSIIKPHINCATQDSFSDIWRKVFSEIAISRKRQPAGFQSNETNRSN